MGGQGRSGLNWSKCLRIQDFAVFWGSWRFREAKVCLSAFDGLLSFTETSLSEERMPHYDPTQHTTADVVRQVIIPMTAGLRRA